MLHRVGLSAHEARHVRPAFEVRALLLNIVAEGEVRRREAAGEDLEEKPPINPPDTPAPAWVDELPT